MSIEDYRRALDAATKEYERIVEERLRLDKRLTELAHSIGTLGKLCGYKPTVMFGLTDACRMVLRSGGIPMTPADVRDRLSAVGVDLGAYANPLAAVHTTLKRLTEAGELRAAIVSPSGKSAYVWHQPPKSDMLARIQARVNNDIEAQQARAARKKR